MKHTILLATALAFLAGGITGYIVHGMAKYDGRYGMDKYEKYDDRGNNAPMGMSGNHAGHGMGMGEHNMHMDMMVRNEREFIEHMIPHHEEAVTTTKEEIGRAHV